MSEERTASILIVEDDENLGLALQDNLLEEGYGVRLCTTGHDALESLEGESADLLILDLMLPDTDGYTLCRKVRESGSSAMIMMLTARTLEEDLVRGFEAGADDYLTKPYRLRELLVRVSALLRRGRGKASTSLDFAGYGVDAQARSVRDPSGAEVELTRTEYDLLVYLLRHRDRALTRQELLDEVWGRDVVVDARTVDNFVSNLKRKLRWSEFGGYQIKTIRGVGYRMHIENAG